MYSTTVVACELCRMKIRSSPCKQQNRCVNNKIVQIHYQVIYQHLVSLSTNSTAQSLNFYRRRITQYRAKLSDQISLIGSTCVNTTIGTNIIQIKIRPGSYSRVYVSFLTCVVST